MAIMSRRFVHLPCRYRNLLQYTEFESISFEFTTFVSHKALSSLFLLILYLRLLMEVLQYALCVVKAFGLCTHVPQRMPLETRARRPHPED